MRHEGKDKVTAGGGTNRNSLGTRHYQNSIRSAYVAREDRFRREHSQQGHTTRHLVECRVLGGLQLQLVLKDGIVST